MEGIWGLRRGVESLACVNRGDGQEVHRVDDELQVVELGRQRLARVDTVSKKAIYTWYTVVLY